MTQVIFCKELGFNILLITREQKAGLHLKFWEQMSSRYNRPWSANMPADHYLVLSAPSTAESRAADSKQPARTKPKGFALTALCECRAFRTKTMEDIRLCSYFADHCVIYISIIYTVVA